MHAGPGAIPTHETPSYSTHLRRSRLHANELRRHQDLHRIEPDYIDSHINIKLYDNIKLRQDHRRVLYRLKNIAKVLHQRGLLPPPIKTLLPP
jgi:hypothetical protein